MMTLALSRVAGEDYRMLSGQKTFGVYEHQVTLPEHPLLAGIGDTITAPHSRWGNIPAKILEDCGIQVLAENEDAGWLLAVRERTTQKGTKGRDIYIQGHLEYGPWDLNGEYLRNLQKAQRTVPIGYYPDDDPNQTPDFRWEDDQRQFFVNMLKQPV